MDDLLRTDLFPKTVVEDSFVYREVSFGCCLSLSGRETDWFTIHLSLWFLFVMGGFQSSLFRLESLWNWSVDFFDYGIHASVILLVVLLPVFYSVSVEIAKLCLKKLL